MAQTQSQVQGDCGKVTYDYTCKYLRDQNCLVNDIYLYGPKVVLVNLDDRCKVEKYEAEGIFLQTGDMLIVTGRENAAAGQEWEEPYSCGCQHFDYDILFPTLDYDLPVITQPGYKQELIVLEATGTGKETFNINLYWGGEEVRSVYIDVYVDMQPGLTAVTYPRNTCSYC